MTVLPQSNARLISVGRESGPGSFTEDYDRDATAETLVWQGNWDAYVQRKIVSGFNDNGELRRMLQVTLFISMDLPIQLEPGDVLTYQAGDPSAYQTFAGRIQNFTDPAYLPTLPDYYKCALEEVNVP